LPPVQILQKFFHRLRGGFFVLERDADSEEGRHIKFPDCNTISDSPQNQAGQNTDSQTAFHHGKDRVIVPKCAVDVGREAAPAEQVGNFGVLTFFQQQKWIIAKRRERNPFLRCQGVVFWQNGEKIVLFQKNGFQVALYRQTQKTAVDAPVLNPMLDFGVIAEQKFIVNIWKILLKRMDYSRQPVCCNA